MTIPPVVVAIGALWNLLAWMWFARVYKLHPLAFLGIPFLILAAIYGWFSLFSVPVDVRADWVRGNLAMIIYAQAPILTVVALAKWRKDRGQ